MTDYLTMYVSNDNQYDRGSVQSVSGSLFLGLSNIITITPSMEAENSNGGRFKQVNVKPRPNDRNIQRNISQHFAIVWPALEVAIVALSGKRAREGKVMYYVR